MQYNFIIVDLKNPSMIINENFRTSEIPIPQEVVLDIMYESICILDTDRPSQSGTTPRLIWALALGKKIMTTNNYIKEMPFYNPNQIRVIDRDNPIIDFDFITSNKNFVITPLVKSLRIDNWLKEIIT